MDDVSGGHWQAELLPPTASASPLAGRQGNAGTARCFGSYTLPTNHGVKHHCEYPGGRFQESPTLLGSPGQARAESRDYLQQFPKRCSHSSCPSWQGGWAPADGASWRTRCPSAPSKPPLVTGLPFLLPAAPPAGTGRAPALPCDHPVPNAIAFLLLHPTSSSLWERNLPTEHLQQLLGHLQLLHLILPDVQRALGRTVTSPELSHCLGKQHRDKGLWTFPLRKGNSLLKSKPLSCWSLAWATLVLFWSCSQQELILGGHGDTQGPSEAVFSPLLPQQEDQKPTSGSNPWLISMRSWTSRRLIPPVRVWTA